ncbi:MAG: hypothetical protein NUV91_01270, partial [Candidatus Omnitrophica bacterium]|nr:hypothetical protein [Candidatus Omnitrophota bacterium]
MPKTGKKAKGLVKKTSSKKLNRKAVFTKSHFRPRVSKSPYRKSFSSFRKEGETFRKESLTLTSSRKRHRLSVKISQPRHKDVILILDFGSQYTQLIARRIRENKVFSRIVPYNTSPEELMKSNPKGLILSGGPMSVYDQGAPQPHPGIFKLGLPILGVCYGMQLLGQVFGGKVEKSKSREFGQAELFV